MFYNSLQGGLLPGIAVLKLFSEIKSPVKDKYQVRDYPRASHCFVNFTSKIKTIGFLKGI